MAYLFPWSLSFLQVSQPQPLCLLPSSPPQTWLHPAAVASVSPAGPSLAAVPSVPAAVPAEAAVTALVAAAPVEVASPQSIAAAAAGRPLLEILNQNNEKKIPINISYTNVILILKKNF